MKIKITGVNYLNTFPFKYGIEKNIHLLEWAEIDYATPFECAERLMQGKTNIALAPVAVLALHPHLKIITQYCLSTNDAVKSVKLYSKKKIDQIQSIILDYQSLSSVSLVKVLMKYYWKKEVRYIQGYDGFQKKLEVDAMVVIGDRTFELNGKFDYEYDLATEWYHFFGKPFVFAAWISNTDLDEKQFNALNAVFEYGVKNIDKVVQHTLNNTNILNFLGKPEREKYITEYLTNNMQYVFDDDRKKSLQYFLKLLKTIETIKVY